MDERYLLGRYSGDRKRRSAGSQKHDGMGKEDMMKEPIQNDLLEISIAVWGAPILCY